MSTTKRRDDAFDALFASLKEVSDSIEVSPKGKVSAIISMFIDFLEECKEIICSIMLDFILPIAYLVLLLVCIVTLIYDAGFERDLVCLIALYILLKNIPLLIGGESSGARRRKYR